MRRKGFGTLALGGEAIVAAPLDPTADPVLAGETPAQR